MADEQPSARILAELETTLQLSRQQQDRLKGALTMVLRLLDEAEPA